MWLAMAKAGGQGTNPRHCNSECRFPDSFAPSRAGWTQGQQGLTGVQNREGEAGGKACTAPGRCWAATGRLKPPGNGTRGLQQSMGAEHGADYVAKRSS
eukprot:3195637-Lingulodinium_polyedra.AAC.1